MSRRAKAGIGKSAAALLAELAWQTASRRHALSFLWQKGSL